MEMNQHAVVWTEIPVNDFERARAFYSEIFDYDMPTQEMGPNMMGFLLFDMGGGVGGAIVKGEGYKPAADGPVVYLNGGSDLDIVLNRVEGAGGKIVAPKTLLTPEIGHVAHFMDSEGNRIALHSKEQG